MPRPKSKQELQDLSQKNFDRLMYLVESFPEIEQGRDFPPGTLNRNIRDVLAHLHHWHLMMLDWYEIGMSGNKPSMPAEGYTWKTTGELNKKINLHYQSIPLDKIKDLLQESHSQVLDLIEKHTNEELFEKKRYPWTGSTSLGAYVISATSSHYDWGYKLIRKGKKAKV